MSALRILALSYLASASVFVVAATLIAHPQMTSQFGAGTQQAATLIDRTLWQPAVAFLFGEPADVSPVVRLTIAPPGPNDARTLARARVMPVASHAVASSDDRITDPQFAAAAQLTILPDLSPESAPVPPDVHFASPQMPRAAAPDFRIARGDDARKPAPDAPAFQIPEPPTLSIAPANDRGTFVARRLIATLTPEMAQNFDLFVYVSKAERGPLAQRLYVFRKEAGTLKLLYDWAASTGREQDEISPRGRHSFTATPKGFYELDPDRMYRRYHSYSWDQDMPHAMFFNWERQGMQTGLAIHSASGDDVAKLGKRASAGCVHLSPENAETLFNLIKSDYRGQAPRFAYNADTQTMSNTGAFAHRRDGSLKMAAGYRVLVNIEDYGGSNAVTALN
jgi:lipoprotein-anchoring transpeptidase ErfK/SrfK